MLRVQFPLVPPDFSIKHLVLGIRNSVASGNYALLLFQVMQLELTERHPP